MGHLFLSYNGENAARAREIADVVRAFGWPVWDYQIDSEQSAAAEAGIAEGLALATKVLALPGPESPWVERELKLAEDRGLEIARVGSDENDAEIIERVLGIRPDAESVEGRKGYYLERKTRRCRGLAAVVLGMVVLHFWWRGSEVVTSHAEWWGRLSDVRLLGMPGHVGLLFGILVTLVLIPVTWSIAGEVARGRQLLLDGQKDSWVAATSIILGISSVGVAYAVTGPGELTERAITGLLGTLIWFLWWKDGRVEGRRLGII